MKLFRATVEVEVFVLAESEDDVYSEADDHAREALGDGGSDTVHVSEVTDLAKVPKDWRDSLPYGDNPDDLTVAQFLTAPPPEQPEQVKDVWTAPLFPEPDASAPEKD